MELGRYLTVRRRQESSSHAKKHVHQNADHLERKRLPLIESPVNEDLYDVLDDDGTPNLDKLRSKASSLPAISSTDGPILYREHHEASTIELFYDLFFVANLATFTAAHKHSDAQSVGSYLGFFSLLWFTWLNSTLYDTRFGTDSVLERLFKCVHFGVMTSFVFCGPIFDSSDDKADTSAYKKFAATMAVEHGVTTIQYIIVLIHSRRYRPALLPLALTILINGLATVSFIITAIVFPIDSISWHSLITWYATKILCGTLTILVSIFYRVISFKHSHLSERVSLLTLIVTGEGIIGLSKSVSGITKDQVTVSVSETGVIVAGVLLLYLIWMLYFDQLVDEGRQGTIRQQVWALLHFPLHCAIVLTVEGNTSLLPWNSAVEGLKVVWSLRPKPDDAPSQNFPDNAAFVSYLNDSMWQIADRYKVSLADSYDWLLKLTSIDEVVQNTTYNSDAYFAEVAPIVDDMFDFAQTFIFEAHESTMYKMSELVSKKSSNSHESLEGMYEIYDTITLYFYISAGAMLLILSAMYWFGKPNHTRSESGGPIIRIIIGLFLIGFGCVAIFIDRSISGFKFKQSNLLIPIVVLAYIVVLAFDALFSFFDTHPQTGRIRFRRSSHKPSEIHRAPSFTKTRTGTFIMSPQSQTDDDDQVPMIPTHSTTPEPPIYDPNMDYSYRPKEAVAMTSGIDSSLPSGSSRNVRLTTGSEYELGEFDQTRMSRFKSLKAPAYVSVNEDEDDLQDDRLSDHDQLR